MPDIFDEVSEDLRAERARALLRRYAAALALLLVLTLIGVGAYDFWTRQTTERASAAAGTFITAQKQAAELDTGLGIRKAPSAALLDDFASLTRSGPGGYRILSSLQLAALDWDQGRHDQAVALWSRIAADGGAPPLLRDLATLTSVEHQLDTGDAQALKAQILPLVQGSSRWRPLAEHMTALLDFRLGRKPQALQIWKSLTLDPQAPPSVRQMAQDLLTTLGEDGAGPRG